MRNDVSLIFCVAVAFLTIHFAISHISCNHSVYNVTQSVGGIQSLSEKNLPLCKYHSMKLYSRLSVKTHRL
jgi:hypothetical protein